MSPRGATVLPIPPLPFPLCREIRFFGQLRSAPFFIFSSCLSYLFVPLEYVEIFNQTAEFDQRNREFFLRWYGNFVISNLVVRVHELHENKIIIYDSRKIIVTIIIYDNL